VRQRAAFWKRNQPREQHAAATVNPNLRRVRGLVNGAKKQMRVCAACIRAGRVKKAA